MTRYLFIAATILVFTASEALAAPVYQVVEFDPSFTPTAINGSGQIAGYFGDGSSHQAAVFDHGIITMLSPPIPSGNNSAATAINDSGQIAIENRPNYNPYVSVSYLYSGGSYVPMAGPDGSYLWPVSLGGSLAPDGSAGGEIFNSSGTPTGYGIFRNGAIQPFTGFDYFVGFNSKSDYLVQTDSDRGGVIYHTDGTTTTVPIAPGFTREILYAFNGSGAVTGYTANDYGLASPFVFANGQFTFFLTDGAILHNLSLITDSGIILGTADFSPSDGIFNETAFIYADGTITKLEGPNIIGNVQPGFVIGMDNNGDILAEYLTDGHAADSRRVSILLVPVPEPSSLLLSVPALAAVILRRGRHPNCEV